MTWIGVVDGLLTLLVCGAFLFGLRTGLTTLIVVRPLCDRLFEASHFEFLGYQPTFGALLNIVVIAAALIHLPKIYHRLPGGLKFAWLPFVLVAAVAVLYSPVPVDGARKLFTYVSFGFMLWFPFVLIKTRADVTFFLKLLLLSSLIPAAYGLFQFLSRQDLYVFEGVSRVWSSFTHPNILAFYLLCVVATIFFILTTKGLGFSEKSKSYLKIYLMFLVILIVSTKTRSAWIGCFFLFVTYGSFYDKRILAYSLLAPAIILFLPGISDRILDLATGNQYVGWAARLNSYAWRVLLWQDALEWIWRRPILGYGLDSFPYYSSVFFPLINSEGTDAHNVFIQLLFETGILGFGTYLWTFWNILKQMLPRFWMERPSTVMGMSLPVTYLICCYSDNMLEYLSVNWYFFFFAGVTIAHFRMGRQAGNPAAGRAWNAVVCPGSRGITSVWAARFRARV